jgi:glycosyltransferase involved in cell wall biosynthesis
VLAIDAANPAARMIHTASAGITVAPGDSAAFVSAVLRVLRDVDLRAAFGSGARKFAENAFSLDNVAPRFLRILERAGVRPQRLESATETNRERLLARAAH